MKHWWEILIRNKKVLQDYSLVLAGTGLGRGLSFLTTLILARALGNREFGVFSLFFTVMMLVWQFPAVLDSVYVRYVNAEPGVGQQEKYLRTVFWSKGWLCLGLLVIAYPSAWILARLFQKPEAAAYLSWAIAAGVFMSLFTTIASMYQAREDFFRFSVWNVLYYGVVFIAVVVLFFWRRPLRACEAMGVSVVAAVVLGIFSVLILWPHIRPFSSIDRSVFVRMLRFGKWLLGSNLAYVMFQRIDVLVLAKAVSYEELGIYSAAVRLAMFAGLLAGGIAMTFMPRGCRALRSEGELKRYLKETTLVTAGLSVFIVLLMLFLPRLINVFLGASYAEALICCRILLLGYVFVIIYTPLSYLFYADDKGLFILGLGLINLISAVVLLFAFVRPFGVEGAAWAVTGSYFLAMLFVIWKTRGILKDARSRLKEGMRGSCRETRRQVSEESYPW